MCRPHRWMREPMGSAEESAIRGESPIWPLSSSSDVQKPVGPDASHFAFGPTAVILRAKVCTPSTNAQSSSVLPTQSNHCVMGQNRSSILSFIQKRKNHDASKQIQRDGRAAKLSVLWAQGSVTWSKNRTFARVKRHSFLEAQIYDGSTLRTHKALGNQGSVLLSHIHNHPLKLREVIPLSKSGPDGESAANNCCINWNFAHGLVHL